MSGKMDYVQILFALSPVPSYLPQYFSIMQQLTPAGNNDGGQTSNDTAAVAMDREGDYYLRKRTPQHDSPTSMMATIGRSPSSNGIPGLSPGALSSRKTFEPPSGGQSNGSSGGKDPEEVDTGLSRATVLLLLSAHLLRLLYFHGLLLEEERPIPPRAGAGLEIDGLITPTSASIESIESPEPETTALQWDLLGQSLCMIVVQILLLHAMMLLRRQHTQRQRKRTSDGAVEVTFSSFTDPPLSSGNMGKPSWRRKVPLAMSTHLYNLFSPHNILQKHSFLEYLELLFLSSMAVKLVFDYHWYPRYRMGVILGLKHTSIVLESCLALPQAIRNYRKETTEGLSVVMVGGWVAGDFFKLCYFVLNMIRGRGPSGNNVFAAGCLLAITLDSIVGIQMAWWYPQPGALQVKNRITRSVRHWKSNKDDDAGESLMTPQRKDGLFAALTRTFFQWARSRQPTNA